jgi:hypothetical protein
MDNPFENKTIIDSAFKKRHFSKIGQVKRRGSIKKVRITKDPDVALAMKQVGEDNVQVHYDSEQ